MATLDISFRNRIEALVNKLHTSVWINHIPDIHKTYPVLVDDMKKFKKANPDAPVTSPLNRPQLVDLLDILAASGRPFDLALIERIFADMPDIFGLQPTPEDHIAVIRALTRNNNVQTIHRWLLTMCEKPGHIHPSRQHWHIFLEYCRDNGELKLLKAAILTMRKTGCGPTNATFQILVDALFKLPPPGPHLNVFSDIFDDMAEQRLYYDHHIASTLRLGYINLGSPQRAMEIQRLYESRFSGLPRSMNEKDDRIARLREEADKLGSRAAVKLCKIYQQGDFTVGTRELATILRNSTTISELRYAEEELRAQSTVVHWTILINNVARNGNITNALSIYSESKRSGICPDAALVYPIIKLLCMTAIRPPGEGAIDQALALYRDLTDATRISTSSESSSTSPKHSRGPDEKIYNVLLRALSSSTNVSKYYPLALSLLDDMNAQNISINVSMTVVSLTILLMRRSSSPSTAFEIYRRMHKMHASIIDATGYSVLLNAYCKLSFPDNPFPSLPHYFSMVTDMQTSGHPITVEVYTILLQQLGLLATRLKEERLPMSVRDGLAAAIRRTHDHLTVDASITPDTPLWNQLMDTYQRVGCFEEAYEVWEMMYLAGRHDNATVSIIIDACGYAGAWQVGKQIFLKLIGDGFLFNQRNWHALVECLCRLGKLNDAVKVVCLEMGKHQEDVAPDVESIRILLKFAIQTNQQSAVQSRIRRYLPKLWETLPAELRRSF